MASYGTLYKFIFKSRNGFTVEINISRLGYTGKPITRPLGRAPLLRRDNNASIYGTSIEIYAECAVAGEYAQLYTSSAYEYKVDLYRNGQNLWTGFVTPELYSEPDRPAPYDVRIVATDGLGELKRSKFYSQGTRTVRYHLEQILNDTGLSRSIMLMSTLRYKDGVLESLPHDGLNFLLDLSHEDGKTRYEVLQHILSSLHASITLYKNCWFIFRETDFIHSVTDQGLNIYANSVAVFYPIASFGSMQSCSWWPISNMTTTIEPAKNGVELTAPYHYMENMLQRWILGNAAEYDSEEKVYKLPAINDSIKQTLAFVSDPVQYKLALKITARNVGNNENPQNIGVRLSIEGIGGIGTGTFWLAKRTDGRLTWKSSNAAILMELPAPASSDDEGNSTDVDIVVPLYRIDSRSFMRANSLAIEIYNPTGAYPIYVHDVTLVRQEQRDGQIVNVAINNGAREKASSVDLQMSDGATIPMGGRWSMTGIPYSSLGGIIAEWISGNHDPEDYLSLMAREYATEIGSARLKYAGRLNVPYEEDLPCLFVRDNTYYWPKTYSYDLYEDEIEVDLISVPDAGVEIESIEMAAEKSRSVIKSN